VTHGGFVVVVNVGGLAVKIITLEIAGMGLIHGKNGTVPVLVSVIMAVNLRRYAGDIHCQNFEA